MDDFEQIDPGHYGDESSSDLNPLYCDGPMRYLTVAPRLFEAEMLQGLLRTEGIPSTISSRAGTTIQGTLLTGGIDIYVPETSLTAAREVLQLEDPVYARQSPLAMGLAVLAGFAILVIVAALLGTH